MDLIMFQKLMESLGYYSTDTNIKSTLDTKYL